VLIHFELNNTTHDRIVDKSVPYYDSRTDEHIVVSLELRSILAGIVVVPGGGIGNRSLAARKVLEVNQHTLMVVEIPKQVDLTMHYLTRQRLNEGNLMLDGRRLAVGLF
jgi:hypothetical protein